MKMRDRLRRLLAGGLLTLGSAVALSCDSMDPGPEGEPFAAPAGLPEAQWEVRSALGTEDEFKRTGGVSEEAFWRANAAEAGVTILPSGLRYRVVRAGDGPSVEGAARVAVAYVTSALDGSRIADSRVGGEAVELAIARMNQGWREAVPRMREGAIWRLYVPAALGRSPSDLGPVPSRIYDVEIVRVLGAESVPADGRLP